MKGPRQYDAFISYSQGEDTRFAEAVQEGLLRLARRWEDLNSLRVFRDKTSLQIGPLAASLQEALENSTYLVVIGSPRSAASEWVLEEIRLFLAHHPPESLLIVLAEGELVWDEAGGYFLVNGKPFPDLGRKVFASMQLFLDLRWAGRADLTIGNPRFLDAMATLAATIVDIPKEQIASEVVREQARLRRNQQINLGFRGTIGFGFTPLMMILWAAVFGFSSASVLSSPSGAFDLYVAGFAMTGFIGALIGGAGFRAAIGFALGFLILLPLYAVGSLRPFQGNAADAIALAALTCAAFVLAGTTGAAFVKGIAARSGSKAFAGGGITAALLFLLFPEWRPEGVHTYLAAGTWIPDRLAIVADKALQVCGELYRDRLFAQLLPLFFASMVGGLLFGISLANVRIAAPKAARRFVGRWLMSTRVRRTLGVCAAALAIAMVAGFAATLTAGYQIRQASHELAAGTFREAFAPEERKPDTFAPEDRKPKEWAEAFVLAARARGAFEKRGDAASAAGISTLLAEWIQTGSEDLVTLVAKNFREVGRLPELDAIVRHAHGAAEKSGNALTKVRIGLAEMEVGQKAQALALLEEAKSGLPKDACWADRAEIGRALFLAGKTVEARDLLQSIATEIATETKDHLAIPVDADDLVPKSTGGPQVAAEVGGDSFRCSEGAASIFAVEGMCSSGKLAQVLDVCHRAGPSETDFWHVQPRLARAAARAGQYETAVGVLDGLRNKTSPGWTDYSDEGEGLIEVISAANDAKREDVRAAAVERVKALEQRVRRANTSEVRLDRFTGVTICRAYAIAGDFDDAWRVAHDLTEAHANGYTAIGAALAERGRDGEARRALRWAWRDLHLNWGAGEGRAAQLSAIGEALASTGDLAAARWVAADIAPDLRYYGGRQEKLLELRVLVDILEGRLTGR